jgi:hypothetical protein
LSCDYCGKEIKKDDRFICAGDYPSWWKIFSASHVNPGFFGQIYHESCYLNMPSKQAQDEKENAIQASPRKTEEPSEEKPSTKRMVR